MSATPTIVRPRSGTPRPPTAAWMALGVFALGALCYANTIRGEFVFDDIKLIVNNDIVKDPRRAADLFLTNLWGLLGRGSNYYRPLPPLLFMGLHAVFGMRPEPFHLLNILLHAGAASLVFLLARVLLSRALADPARTLGPACAAGAVFAVHPIHTEAVAWISGVMDVSCTFFSLVAIYGYATRDEGRRRGLREALSLGALALALLSKEPAAVVPFALVAYDLLFCRERIVGVSSALRRWGPSFVVLTGYLWLRSLALGGVAPFRHEDETTLLQVWLTVPWLFALYVQKLVLPVGLTVVHDIEPITAAGSPEFLLALVVIAGFGVLSRAAFLAGPAAAYGGLLFVLALAPALYVPALGQDLSKAFAERYLYLPSVGAALLVAGGLATLGNRAGRLYPAALASIAVVSIVCAGMTLSRNTVWRDNVALWSDGVRKSPDVPRARENLGLALIRAGQVQEGMRELRAALTLEPGLPRESLANGVLAAQQGLVLQAILYFQTALLYDPTFAEARYNLGVAFEKMGRNSAAIQEYRATIAQAPDHAEAHNNLGIILAQTHRLDEAIPHFESAVRARPRDPELHLNLARAYEAQGLARQAQEQRALAALAGANLTR